MTPEEWDALRRKIEVWEEWKKRKDEEARAKDLVELVKKAQSLRQGQ
jgi:hypothetical protein